MSIVTVRKTVVYDVDWASVAQAVEQKAMAKLKEDLKNWSDDRSMLVMFLGDASDALSVCEVIETGNWRDIEERLWKMDTASREYVYDWIEQAAGVNWNELTQNMA